MPEADGGVLSNLDNGASNTMKYYYAKVRKSIYFSEEAARELRSTVSCAFSAVVKVIYFLTMKLEVSAIVIHVES